ncbi:hypothetical protein PR048_026825 [Dryococelus australis]|uniref:Uncharacterized protein n=1 Tax=Dryococelus australis TaxID=614101 RepID=A0ABQ9GMD8_9NEOP|nr:hypothetical protein PR048_026825 [Dryococelus australis]
MESHCINCYSSEDMQCAICKERYDAAYIPGDAGEQQHLCLDCGSLEMREGAADPYHTVLPQNISSYRNGCDYKQTTTKIYYRLLKGNTASHNALKGHKLSHFFKDTRRRCNVFSSAEYSLDQNVSRFYQRYLHQELHPRHRTSMTEQAIPENFLSNVPAQSSQYADTLSGAQRKIDDYFYRPTSAAVELAMTHISQKDEITLWQWAVITNIPGKSSVVNFKGTAGQLLHDKLYSNRKSSSTEELFHIVKSAAEIRKEDIRSIYYDCTTYTALDHTHLSDCSMFPDTMYSVLETIISSHKSDSNSIIRKRLAIGQALISACRPRSFLSSMLIAIGVVSLSRIQVAIVLLSSVYVASIISIEVYCRTACQATTVNPLASHQGEPGSIPGRVTGFHMWELGRTMPLVGGFSRESPVSPTPSFRRHSTLTLITPIGSQYLAVKSSPNLFTHSVFTISPRRGMIFPTALSEV